MQIEMKPIKDVIPYENNPRKNDDAVEYVANSIREFGWQQPIVVDKDGVVIVGHTRLKAAQRLGYKEVPVVYADNLTDEQVKAYRLADNKTNEFAAWDFDKLDEELDGLLDFDMEEFGFRLIDDVNPYMQKVKAPIYEVTGDCPLESELYDKVKTDELIDEIENSRIEQSIKKFLEIAAYRHVVFNYGKIAEYYAHADKNVQNLMERSALVIIDYDDAIRNGFTTLSREIDGIINDG